MTFLEQQDMLMSLLRDANISVDLWAPAGDLTDIKAWLNEGLQQTCIMLPRQSVEYLLATNTCDMSIGTSDYGIENSSDFNATDFLVDEELRVTCGTGTLKKMRPAKRIDRNILLSDNFLTTGNALQPVYCIRDVGSGTRLHWLTIAPTAAYTEENAMELDFRRKAAVLSDNGDIPEIDDHLHMLPVYWAGRIATIKSEDTLAYQQFDRFFNSGISAEYLKLGLPMKEEEAEGES